MVQKIIGLLFSIFLIYGGASGLMVLRGTNSSAALIVAGVVFLILDIYSIATHKKKDDEETKRHQVEIAAVNEVKYAHLYPGKKKGWAIAWWFLGDFGFFGLHSFYLGKKKAGILKIVALLSTCAIPVIIAKYLIDAGNRPGNPIIILPGLGVTAIFIWNIVDLVQIIRLPKVAYEAEPQDSSTKE
jgi:hypothetical protein